MGEEGGIQAAWWLGGDEAQKGLKLAGGEQATAVMGLLLFCKPSEARSLENMASASGKLGGVAGVLLGVHICWERTQVSERGTGTQPPTLSHRCAPTGPRVGLPQAGHASIPICQSTGSFNRTEAPSHPELTQTKNKDKP